MKTAANGRRGAGLVSQSGAAEPQREGNTGLPPASASLGTVRNGRSAAPSNASLDDDDDDDDLDDDDSHIDEEEEEEEDEDDENACLNLPPEVVANDDPELLAFLRTAAKEKAAPHPLPDWLQERDDPRAPVVQAVTTPPVVLPAAPPPWADSFPLIASPLWYAEVQYNRVIAKAYPGTELFRFLSRYGARNVEVRAHPATRTADTVRDAAERCRLRLLLALFDLEEADLKPARGGSVAARANQLVRSLRRNRRPAVPRVCEAIRRRPEVGPAVLQALTRDAGDHDLWERLMDALNPNWRTSVALMATK